MLYPIEGYEISITLQEKDLLKVQGLEKYEPRTADKVRSFIKSHKTELIEKIKNSEKVDYKIYSEDAQNISLIDGKIAKYRDGEFKCELCGRMFFLILADGLKACYDCWQPEDESVYMKRAKPLQGFKHIYPEKPVLPKRHRFFYAGGLEACFLYSREDKQIKCKHCGGELFTPAYNFETVCISCGSGVLKRTEARINIETS